MRTGADHSITAGYGRRAAAGLCAMLLLVAWCAHGQSFTANAVNLCGAGAEVKGLLVADFDGDGADDLAAGCETRHEPLKGHVEIWRWDASAGMHRVQSEALGSFKTGGEGAGPITAADFNEDGNLDLVVVDKAGMKHGISLLYGRDNGKFGPPTYFAMEYTRLAALDVNGDGHQDLIPFLHGRGGRHYIPGDGGKLNPNRFLHPTNLPWVRIGLKGGATVELNGDRLNDVVTPEPRAGKLHVFPSGGAPYTLTMGKSVRSIQRIFAGADVDGDGSADLLVCTGASKRQCTVRWLLTSAGVHLSDAVSGVSAGVSSIAVADFDGDGTADLLVGPHRGTGSEDHGSVHLTLLAGQRDGGYQKPQTIALPISPDTWWRWKIGDFNGDGRADLIYLRFTADQDRETIYLSHG